MAITNVIFEGDGGMILEHNGQRVRHSIRNILDRPLSKIFGECAIPPARIEETYIDFCSVEPEVQWMSLPQILGALGNMEARIEASYLNACFIAQ